MNKLPDRLSYLFGRYYDKTASLQEKEELLRMLREHTGEGELTELLRQAWEKLPEKDPLLLPLRSEEMLEGILEADALEAHPEETHPDEAHPEEAPREKIAVSALPSPPQETAMRPARSFPWKRIAAAAVAVLVLALASLYVRKARHPERPASALEQGMADIRPGGNKALLTLEDGSVIELDSASVGNLAMQGGTRIAKTAEGRLAYELPSGEGAQAPDENAIHVYNTLSTPRGGQYQLVLPDGTKVWLNAASSLRFPAAFSQKERRVELEGEAYFEVAKNARVPFRVSLGKAEVEVLGTSFNISAYRDEETVRTTLMEGSVKVSLAGAAGESRVLEPGQQAEISGTSSGTGEIRVASGVDVREALAWKDGLFRFSGAGIESVMRQISRWYDIEIRYEGEVPQRQFTGKVPRSVEISELLNMLQYAGVRLRVEGRTVVVEP